MMVKKRTYYDRVKAIPGSAQVFRRVIKASYFASIDSKGNLDNNKYRDIATLLIKKFAELWELTPSMEQYLIQSWVEFNNSDTRKEVTPVSKDVLSKEMGGVKKSYKRNISKNQEGLMALYEPPKKMPSRDLISEILYIEKKDIHKEKIRKKLSEKDAKLIDISELREGHLYLDVTGLDYKGFRELYRIVNLCRDLLDISTKEIKRGAPDSIDYTRAIMLARAAERGLSRKELAKMLDYKIYTEDNPSGSYPLLQKHLKIGRVLVERLDKLDEYIKEVTGLEV